MIKSFFEYLGNASTERIHSQILAWLFSSNCNAISPFEKLKLLNNFFKISANAIINTQTECDGVDIVIETDTVRIVIENKLKSSEHSEQLNRYWNFCESKYKDKQCKYYYLTLMGDESNNDSWIDISYVDLYKNLSLIDFNSENNHKIILTEYIYFLKRLAEVITDFIKNPNLYSQVFLDGSKRKVEKLSTQHQSQNVQFISDNQLETILQKKFLKNISLEFSNLNPVIGETRGNALINLEIENVFYNKRDYKIFLQLQGNIIKFCFAANNYKESQKSWILDILPIMKLLSTENKFGYTRSNSPKQKAYISISKPIQQYWTMENKDLLNYISIEVENCRELSKILKTRISQI